MLPPVPPGFRHYKELFRVYAERFGLAPALVAAVAWKESDCNTDAFRFEQGFWNKYLKTLAQFKGTNPRRFSSSYGLMQVMYQTAVEHGYTQEPEAMFDPEIGVRWGCTVLAARFKWLQGLGINDAGVVERAALASYNGGRGGNNPLKDNPLRNGRYADDVLARKIVMEREYGR